MNPSGAYEIPQWQKWGKLILRQLALQITLIFIGITVLFPIIWILSIATDERGLPQYSELNLIPQGFTLNAFEELIFEPFETLSSANKEIYFTRLLSNSLFVALGTAMLSVGLGASAAYAFSRFKFIGRKMGLLGFILLLMMPATGTLVPLIAIFSLFRIHVVFNALAPAIFYGVIVALVGVGIKSAIQSLLKFPLFEEPRLRWLAYAIAFLSMFGMIYLAWTLMFTQSDVYKETIRAGLRSTNVIEDEISDLQGNIPRDQDNINRQQRRLDAAKAERASAEDGFTAVNEIFPGVYTLVGDVNALTIGFGDAATATNRSLLEQVYTVQDMQSIILAGLDAGVVDQAATVETAKADLKATQDNLAAKEIELEEARAPYIAQRNEAIGKLFPYVLASFAAALVLTGVVWYGSGLPNMAHGSLMRRDRLKRVFFILYVVIIVGVSYEWFTSYYESPTKQIGLEGGGLWYDVRLSFRDETDIEAELAPYIERTDLETSREQLATMGVSEFYAMRQAQYEGIVDLITRLEAVDVSLNPPDNLTRREKIDWKDTRREARRAELRAIQSEAQDYIGITNRFNLYNNENLKVELLKLLEERRDDLKRELDLVTFEDTTEPANVFELGVATPNRIDDALAAFDREIEKLPDDAKEYDRLQKELDIRSSNSGNVTETVKITLFGLMIAYSSSALPFAIWNLKGYFDTIPKELEEAAMVDGANMVETFFRIILPLSLPALAITTLFGFMTGWTEFILAVQFLTAGDVDRTTLAMALRGIAGGGTTQAEPDYTQFAAMSILMAIPVVSLFYIFQRWIVSGLTVGGVKG